MTFLGRMSAILCIASTVINHSWAADWPNELLNLTGTSIIFDNTDVQKSLQQMQTPDLNQLLQDSHFKAWAGARLWVVQLSNNQVQFYKLDKTLETNAQQRGIMLTNQLDNAQLPLLQQAISQYASDTSLLNNLLKQQQSDALLTISPQAQFSQWKILSSEYQLSGTVKKEALDYLAHIWAENLGMIWQWPELKTGILLRIDNISHFEQFIQAENALKTACPQLKLLQINGYQVDFHCITTASYPQLVDKLRLVPQLLAQPLATGISANVLIGQQLAQRYAYYYWQKELY